MSSDHAALVRDFLGDSLALWGVDSTVETGAPPIVAVICVRLGATVWIELPTETDLPWRWFVRWRDPGMQEERSRPCASLVGLLGALRGALGVDRGNALRIAPPPVDA